MSIDTTGPGRFCNQVIRSSFASILAKKFDLAVEYAHGAELSRLGLELYNGSVVLSGEFTPTTENAVLDIIEERVPPAATKYGFHNNECYFQSKRHTALLREWLRSQVDKIRAANPFAGRYRNNSEVFLHVRLGDVPSYNPGLEYYRAALGRVGASVVGCISSDSPQHPLVQQLVSEYPGLKIVHTEDLVQLIQFASTFAHVILSHGTFSAVIGFLAFDSTVYYAPYNTIWCGDMFTQPDWVLVG